MENKSTHYWIPIVMATCLAVGLYLGNILTPEKVATQSLGESRYQKMQDIIQILDGRYVDAVNSEELFETTIGDMLHKLDPHSNYIPAKDLQAMNEAMAGKFGGVGIRFFIIRDTVCVTNVLPDSPAMRAGLKSGDKILEVDGTKVVHVKISNEEIMGMLKGTENTPVNLTVLRDNKKIKKKVVRGSIPVVSVLAAYMVDKTIGFIKIEQFSMTTSYEFEEATARLKSQGMKKLIIDLRNNGGGVLTGATKIADEFLKANIPIVETKGAHAMPYTYRATTKGNLEDIQVAILINSNSASASEILAGAIQDNDRGTIIGRRSFGKGLVQEDVMLRDGSNLRLTIARYYTPTGRCIQKPYSDDYDEYMSDQVGRYDNGEMYKVDSTLLVDSLKFKTPKGKVVYGGGGIMPDIFVPYDTTGSTWYLTQLRYTNVFTTFAFDFVQGKRTKWSSLSDFKKRFAVSDELLNHLIVFASSEYKIKLNKKEFATSKKLISEILKAEIARQIWVEEGYYEVYNDFDPEVQRAIRFFK